MGNNIVKPTNSEPCEKLIFALGVIDPQIDFCKGGALEVKESEGVIAAINKLRFICYDHIVTFISQEYHPYNHMSFATTYNTKPMTRICLELDMGLGSKLNVQQVLWPKHCVQNTKGVEFHPDLIVSEQDKIIQKGTMHNVKSYSAFGDEYRGKYEKTELKEWLTNKNITDIILVGFPTDYCFYNTGLDAILNGYKVHLILSCTRGVSDDTTNKALADLLIKGAYMYSSVDDFYVKHQTCINNSTKM